MLQYVEDLESVVNEIVRVAKPEAMVSLSLTVPDILASYAGDARAGSAQKTLDLFGTHVKHVYFRNDISPHSPGNKHEVVFQFTK